MYSLGRLLWTHLIWAIVYYDQLKSSQQDMRDSVASLLPGPPDFNQWCYLYQDKHKYLHQLKEKFREEIKSI